VIQVSLYHYMYSKYRCYCKVLQ